MHDNYKFRNLSLHILATALDDICPKFEEVPLKQRSKLFKERNTEFKKVEKLLDEEWRALERDASYEVRALKEERLSVIRKLNETRKSKKIKMKLSVLKNNKAKRITYLKEKYKTSSKAIKEKLALLNPTSKKFAQITKKLDKLKADTDKKIQIASDRYDKIIKRTLDSDNTENVELRIQQAHEVWDRKYKELMQKYDDHVEVFQNKRDEFDLIRVSIEDFEENLNGIKHLCEWAGIDVKQCYLEARDRMSFLGRKSEKIDKIIESLHLIRD